MGATADPVTIDPAELEAWVDHVLRETGASEAAAAATAHALTSASRRGLDSHGVEYLHYYLPKLASGVTRGDVEPSVVVELPALAIVDGNAGMGAYVARFSMGLACDKAREVGAAIVGVRNSSHFGAASVYAEQAAARGCVGISLSNSDPGLAPLGALEPVLGTNPLAIAAPAGSSGVTPSLDMAMSTVAFSHVIRAGRAGESIPDDWAIGADGRPTEDPHAAHSGLPFGGHKGFALAFMIDILAGCLTGGASSQDIRVESPEMSEPQNTSHLFIAIDLDAARDRADYERSLDRLIEMVHGAPTAEWANELMFPGEPEARAAGARADGIPVRPDTLEMLRRLGAQYGSPFPV